MPTIREILLLSGTTESSSKNVIDKLHDAVMPFMPLEWKDWIVQWDTAHELVGDPPDPKIVNKLRYAIPTADIAAAFNLRELRPHLCPIFPGDQNTRGKCGKIPEHCQTDEATTSQPG